MRAHIKQQEILEERALRQAWNIANFTGAAFAGKLKKYDYYLKRTQSRSARNTAPAISEEEFDRKLAKAKAGEKNRKNSKR